MSFQEQVDAARRRLAQVPPAYRPTVTRPRGEHMSHHRAVCQHDVVVSQCRCITAHKITEVVRPCPFGTQHRGWSVVHPEHATAGPHEPPQAPEGEPMTPGPVSQVPPGASGAAEGFGPRAFKACVFRTCDWTIAEPDSLLGYPGMDAEIRIHLRTHRVEIELMAEAIR